MHVGVLLGQMDQVLGADLAEQLRFLAELGNRLVQPLLALVQAGEDGSAADLQAAGVQFVAELGRVLRQEALRSEFGPHVTGVGDLVEVGVPGDLLGICGEPHPPGVGCGAEQQLRHVLGGHVRGHGQFSLKGVR